MGTAAPVIAAAAGLMVGDMARVPVRGLERPALRLVHGDDRVAGGEGAPRLEGGAAPPSGTSHPRKTDGQAGAGDGAGGVRVFHSRADLPVFKWGDGSWINGRPVRLGRRGDCRAAAVLGAGAPPAPPSASRLDGPAADATNASVYLAAFPAPGAVTRGRVRGTGGGGAVTEAEARLLTRETVDPADRAHAIRIGDRLVPAATAGAAARPRRYPPGQLTSRGVSFDSQYDELYAAESRLARLGVAGFGARGLGGATSASVSAHAVDQAARAAARRGRRLEDLVERPLRVGDRVEMPGLESAESVIARYHAGAWRPDEA